MRRFQFPLDPALRLRRRLEEQAQLELSEALRCLETEGRAVQVTERDQERCQRRREELQRAAVDLRLLVEEERYAEQLARELSQRRKRLEEAAAAVETARGTLLQRRIDRESLERLRDRRLAEHREEGLRVEQQEMDELSVLRWRRDARGMRDEVSQCPKD